MSTHPSSFQQISEFVYMHQYQNVLIPLQLKRLKSAKIYIKIDLLHLTRLQFWSLFPLTQPMHVSKLDKNTHTHCKMVLCIHQHNPDKFHPRCYIDLPHSSVDKLMNKLLHNILLSDILEESVKYNMK